MVSISGTRLSGMESDTEKKIDLLLKKYNLYSQHHFNQNQLTHTRLNLLWLIQAALFAGLYVAFQIPNRFLGYIVGFSSMGICIMWFFVITRTRASSLLRQQALRDVEWELKSLGLEINLWIVDRKCMEQKQPSPKQKWINRLLGNLFKDTASHKWEYAPEGEKEEFKLKWYQRIFSASDLFNFLPIALLLIWLIVILGVVPSIPDP